MILRKAMVIVFLLNAMMLNSFAQNQDSLNPKPVSDKKYYYQMGIGYNFFAGIGVRSNNSTDRSWNYTQANHNASYGKGFDISFGLGVKAARNLALELEIGYLIGAKDKEDDQYYDTTYAYPLIIKEKRSFKANTFRINPKFVFEIPLKNDHCFYSKIGYMIGVGNAKSSTQSQWYYDNGWYGEGSFERTYTGGIVSGSTMALGFRFATKEEDTYFFMELTGANLHRTFKKGTMTTAIANGQNDIDNQPDFYKEFIYVDQAEYNLKGRDLYEPRQIPAYRANYSSVGFRLGFAKYF